MFHASEWSSVGAMKMFPAAATLSSFWGKPQEMVDKRNISGGHQRVDSTDQLIS